jgi:hypothetical protein
VYHRASEFVPGARRRCRFGPVKTSHQVGGGKAVTGGSRIDYIAHRLGLDAVM